MSTQGKGSRSGLPDFLIIGPPRTGTTSLHFQLANHVGVQPPVFLHGLRSKELHFFDVNYLAGIEWYMQHFPQPKTDKLYFESTPDYIFDPKVPWRIQKWMPDCKFIVSLRNPVDRAWSEYYFYWMPLYGMSIENLYDSIDIVTEDMPEVKKIPMTDKSYHRLLQGGLYAKMLERWFGIFESEQFCILKSEDFYADPKSTIHQLCEFLGISRMTLDKYEMFDPLKNVRGAEYPACPRILKEQLEHFYKPYNDKLKDMIGVKWND